MHRILHLIAKIDRKDNQAPEWMLLFAAGWGELADGVKFFVDKAAFDLIQAGIRNRGNDIHFDFEHASLGTDPAPAAGWIKELAWTDGNGIMARVEWTARAAEMIEQKEYRYYSPVFYIRKEDQRVCGLHSVALTNTPKTNFLTPILARLEAGLEQTKEETMDRDKLIAALGLDKDATDADILAAIAKLGVTLPEEKETVREVIPEKVTAALDLKADDDESTVVASIHALKQGQDNSVSRAEFDSLKKELDDKNASDAVAAAMKAGKIAPAQKDWAVAYAKEDLKGFETFVAKAPQVIPVDQLPGKKQEALDPVSDETTRQVAAMMDVDLADIKKYNG